MRDRQVAAGASLEVLGLLCYAILGPTKGDSDDGLCWSPFGGVGPVF